MIALLLALQVAAGPTAVAPQVTARVTPEAPSVGEPITVELRVRAALGSEIRFPAVPDSADAVEPLDPRLIRDASTAHLVDRTAVYRLIAWDTGARTITFGDIAVARAGATQNYRVALPAIRVRSVLPADSAARVPRPPRDALAIPGGWWRLWLGLAVVLALAYLGWRAWRRHKARVAEAGPDAARLAEEGFTHAAALGLLEAGEPGRFVLAHVEVMRRYLALRFPQAAPSRTAREVADALVGAEFPILPERVAELLLQSEPIAFARAPVSQEAARAMAKEARAIVGDVETAWRSRRAAAAQDGRPRRRR